jgi:two-component system sensor kinase FixL
VLLNLIRNAGEALAGTSDPRIEIATALAASGMIEIRVSDNGPGLPAEVRDRLFQPFVTTKEAGTGVGLSICQGIVEAHGGTLAAEDRPGGGTVFRFTVPKAQMRLREVGLAA